MGELANAWRNKFALPVIAVTGSNGKTTVKEMLASILSLQAPVLSTQGNLNNDIGDDEIPCDAKKAKQVVLCSGKVYYDLLEEREKRGLEEVHFLRLEQIYPFPADALSNLIKAYKHCDLVWCQEEPRNMGAWPFASTFINEVAEILNFKNPRVRYAGRKSAGSPATGQASRHAAEQKALVDDALTLGKKAMSRIQTRVAEEKAKARKDRAKAKQAAKAG